MTNKIEKKIVDGKVAVLHSPCIGGNWNYNSDKEPVNLAKMFDPVIVDLVLAGVWENQRKIIAHCELSHDSDASYIFKHCGNQTPLAVAWVPVDEWFYIKDYDGQETVITKDSPMVFVAKDC